MDTFHVVYLTGSPATGKSTLLKGLQQVVKPLLSISYSALLAGYLNERDQAAYSREDLRKHSAAVVTPEDIAAVDSILLESIRQNRNSTHIVIDSHAVTKEEFGFRVTPFSLMQIEAIKPTLIICLFAKPEAVVNRIAQNSGGRPVPTVFEAAMHSELQASVAITYAMHLGLPVYFFDTDRPPEELMVEIVRRLRR
jgi:adenylate kinase